MGQGPDRTSKAASIGHNRGAALDDKGARPNRGPRLLRTAAFCRQENQSAQYVNELKAAGELPFVRIGDTDWIDVHAWYDRLDKAVETGQPIAIDSEQRAARLGRKHAHRDRVRPLKTNKTARHPGRPRKPRELQPPA